jgi:hypothetical protein
VCANRLLVLDPLRPIGSSRRSKRPSDFAARRRLANAGNHRPSAGTLAIAPVKTRALKTFVYGGTEVSAQVLSPRTSTWLNVLTTLEVVSGRCDQ